MNASVPIHRSFRLSARSQPAFTRAAWKEYRMLRGFWLGVAALGVLQMFAASWLLAPESRPAWMFASAWGAAALYAVGAAVTLFSVEREEQTDRFLTLLPRHNGALLAGKLVAAIVTCLCLLLVLAVVGSIIAGGRWPNAATARDIAGLGGLFLIEALVWGLLASLVIANPLLAAVAAMAAASIAAQLAIFATSQTSHGFSFSDYQEAVPIQLLITAAVGLLDVRLGLRWLSTPRVGVRRRPFRSDAPSFHAVIPSAATTSAVAATTAPINRRRLFARLVWQSWREGWAAMLLALPIGLFLMASDVLIAWSIFRVPHVPISLFVIPALYGALVFRADQRGRQFRFLADRAAPPRLVWTARQTSWLAPLIMLAAAVHVAALTGLGTLFFNQVMETLISGWSRYGSLTDLTPEFFALNLRRLARLALSGGLLAWCGLLASYAVGQFASMAIRSIVLAGFVALAASVVITLWSYVAAAWELASQWFVLPIAIGALVATFLLARAWLTERRGLRKWLAPLASVVAPLALISFMLPKVRMAQVEDTDVRYRFLRQPLAAGVNKWTTAEPAARATALRYEQIFAEMQNVTAPIGTAVGDGFALTIETTDGRARSAWEAIDPQVRSQASGAAENDALQQRKNYLEQNQARFDELAILSQEHYCRFGTGERLGGVLRWLPTLLHVVLSDAARLTDAGDLDRALTRLMTWLRISAHVSQYPRGEARISIGEHGSSVYSNLLLRWAESPAQSSELLRRAVKEMTEAERLFPSASDSLIAQYLEVRDVVLGNQPPSFMRDADSGADKPPWHEQLAFLANELPWEQRRALVALEKLTEARLDYADAVSHCLIPADRANAGAPGNADTLSKFLHVQTWDASSGWTEILGLLANYYSWAAVKGQQSLVRACSTSYLVGIETQRAGDLAFAMQQTLRAQAACQAEVIRMALIAYRFDRREYPTSLFELVPTYLPAMPTDPFACTAFEYRRDGFEHPIVLDKERNAEAAIPRFTPVIWSVGPRRSEPVVLLARVTAEGQRRETIDGRTYIGPEGDVRRATVTGEEAMRRIVRFLPPGAVVLPLPSTESESESPPVEE